MTKDAKEEKAAELYNRDHHVPAGWTGWHLADEADRAHFRAKADDVIASERMKGMGRRP